MKHLQARVHPNGCDKMVAYVLNPIYSVLEFHYYLLKTVAM